MSFQDYPTALRQDSILHGRYIIQDVLGQGSFGITYKALDYQTNEQIAIKEYFPSSLSVRQQNGIVMPRDSAQQGIFREGKKWFLKEVMTLSAFTGNPNIVRIYSFFEENDTAYFSMEYVKGVSLTDYVSSRGGRIPWPEAWELLLPIMDALSSVHSKDIIHRDIKPDNIMISDGNNARILDFGAARFSYGQESRSLDVILTRGFAPLEQYYRRGKQGAWTDVYGLGATLYSAITGEIPPDAVKRSYKDELMPPTSLGVMIPDYAQNALLKALAVHAVVRFESMRDFKNA
ncbi:MAG: serine/threonine-protein kinase, partial [Eubacteriales bacterium]|nr:serine/threonine-protein kinase [Eubacteriales bacterium]